MSERNGTKENQTPQGLTEKQIKAIPFLVTSPNYAEGIKKAKIGKTTLYKWLKNPEFVKELEIERNEVVEEALNTLKTSLTKAVNTLVGLLDEGSREHKRRVCKDIIDYVIKVKELQEYKELQERLESVERIVLEKKKYR